MYGALRPVGDRQARECERARLGEERHPAALKTAAGVAIVLALKEEFFGDKGGTAILPGGQVVQRRPAPET